MWVLRIYQQREVLPGVYNASVVHRQYFADEDSAKAQSIADDLNKSYKELSRDDYWAEAHKG